MPYSNDRARYHHHSPQLGGRKGKPLRSVFDGSISITEIMSSLEGHGGTSRMFARGKPKEEELSSVGQFFSRGSTLEKATAFTKSAVAFESNASLCGASGRPVPKPRPHTIAEELDSNEHPVQEMQFFNVGGAKVFYYYGLDTIRTPEHVMNAGPHVRDTAVGVLMLDQYKIQERPGDPSNPLTFWPYQTFYVIPQGVTFERCKTVGSAGANALRDYPLETTAICQALLAVSEVASRCGYQRLIIIGDCGYYSLAAEALSKSLSCWGSMSWTPHPCGAFASYRVPRFRSRSLDLDVILCLGTTQLISSPEPEKNLSTQLGVDTSVVYLTADLRGWYSGEALQEIDAIYKKYERRPWNDASWHFNLDCELSMLDLVAQVNNALLAGVVVQENDYALYKVTDSLIELNAGSTAFLIGMFLGYTASKLRDDKRSPAERAFFCSSELCHLAENMALDSSGNPHRPEVIVEKVAALFDYIRPILSRIMDVVEGKAIKELTQEQEFRALAILVGNPSLKGSPAPTSYEEFKLQLSLRIQDTFMSLMTIGKLSPDVSGLPLGNMYVEFYANFLSRLNRKVLPKVSRHHAIDGRTFPLFDCRFVPGFGFQVSQGLTVWTTCQNYLWMNSTLLRFSEIMQTQAWMGAAAYHLECTELFSFTPFFHEMGVPMVDGVNQVILASRLTDAPVRFVNFTQTGGEPPTPSALVADTSSTSLFGVSYYRDESLALRTPTGDSNLYKICSSLCNSILQADRERWTKIRLARPMYEDYELEWGPSSYNTAKPGDSIYPASSALDISRYVGKTGTPVSDDGGGGTSAENDFVQYAPRKDGELEDLDFSSFFGGNVYRDRKVGSKTVAYRVTPASSSSFAMDDSEASGNYGRKKDGRRAIIERRVSW